MSKNLFNTTGTNFKTFTCKETGEEVSRRKSFAINFKGVGTILGKGANGKNATCARPCNRIKTRKKN